VARLGIVSRVAQRSISEGRSRGLRHEEELDRRASLPLLDHMPRLVWEMPLLPGGDVELASTGEGQRVYTTGLL